MHDGLLLPQLFRRHGLRTDIADLTHLATCRMYRNASEVWRGLAKNATEGMAAPARILPFTILLFCGQVLPLLLALSLAVSPGSYTGRARTLILVALAASFVPRLLSVWKYRQSLLSALLHPVGVTLLLVLQWYALLRKLSRPACYLERTCLSHGLMPGLVALRLRPFCLFPSKNRGVPHISLVFREMWETTNLNLFPTFERSTWSAVVSHISRKTIWGTPRFLEGRKLDKPHLRGLRAK